MALICIILASRTLDWVVTFSINLACCFHYPEYCQKYAKPEDIGAVPEEKSSDEELSEDECDSSDEEVAGPADL